MKAGMTLGQAIAEFEDRVSKVEQHAREHGCPDCQYVHDRGIVECREGADEMDINEFSEAEKVAYELGYRKAQMEEIVRLLGGIESKLDEALQHSEAALAETSRLAPKKPWWKW